MGKPANSDPKLEAILSPVLPSLKRFLEKQGLVGYNSESNHQTILPILKIFKINPESQFIDAEEFGENLKVKYMLDKDGKKRIKEERARRNNELLKIRINKLIEENRENELKKELMNMTADNREKYRRKIVEGKKLRIKIFDDLLFQENFGVGLESSSRTNLNDFIKQVDYKEKDIALEEKIAIETNRLQEEFEIEEKEEELPRDQALLEEIETRKNFLEDFEKRMKAMINNIEGSMFCLNQRVNRGKFYLKQRT